MYSNVKSKTTEMKSYIQLIFTALGWWFSYIDSGLLLNEDVGCDKFNTAVVWKW